MITLARLWLPILLSGVLVFVASSLIHMFLKWHDSDYRPLPLEEEVMEALRRSGAAPGQYLFPHCGGHQEANKPESLARFERGPVGFLHLIAPGRPRMGKSMGQWLLFTLAVSLSCAYLASRTLAPGVAGLQVFRVTGTVAFLSYAAGTLQGSIWMGKPWSVTLKEVADGLIYALVTGAVFASLWPR